MKKRSEKISAIRKLGFRASVTQIADFSAKEFLGKCLKTKFISIQIDAKEQGGNLLSRRGGGLFFYMLKKK